MDMTNKAPTSQLMHAIAAHYKGWCIFPCEPGEKQGALIEEGKPWRIKWFESATNDLDTILRVWRDTNPLYNIGISAKLSGLLIVDCDVPKEFTAYTQADGVEQYRKLVEQCSTADWHDAIDTYQVETPSGGLHFYYKWPEGVQASQAKLAPLVDVRSNGGEKGGYVVGAGSATRKGWYYCPNPAPIKTAPPWLVEMVREKNPFQPSRDPFQKAHGVSLTGLHRYLLEAPEGRRNDSLFWVAAQAAEERPDMDVNDLMEEFWDPALSIGLSPNEIRASVRSGYRKAHRR